METHPIPAPPPRYYQRLIGYFPEQEMKPLGQLEDLLAHSGFYQKFEDETTLVLYADFPEFLFIDYFLVQSPIRSKGIGTRVLRRFQSHCKPIVLEVEPENPKDPDTFLRRKFYLRNGFSAAVDLVYRRINAKGEPFDMDVFLWSPDPARGQDARTALKCMKRVCREVHNYHALQYYGRIPADPAQVLWLTSEIPEPSSIPVIPAGLGWDGLTGPQPSAE